MTIVKGRVVPSDPSGESGNTTVEWLYSDDLKIDVRVQQLLNPARAATIGKRFNPDLLGSLVVSRRANGDNMVSDGQHRWKGGDLAGYTGAYLCIVHHGLSLADEASLFLGLNFHANPSAITKFIIRLVEADAVAQAIEKIVMTHGWQIARSQTKDSISAVAALENVYLTAATGRKKGEHEDVLDKTMSVITSAWGYGTINVHATILQGFGAIFGRIGDHVDVSKMITEMHRHDPIDLLGSAKALHRTQGGRVHLAFAKVVVGHYNKGKRINLLPEWIWTR